MYTVGCHKEPTKGYPPSRRLGMGVTSSCHIKPICYKMLHRALGLDTFLAMT
jgi:hypothetical protein